MRRAWRPTATVRTLASGVTSALFCQRGHCLGMGWLSAAQYATMAGVGHDGLAHAVRPAHSTVDGDTIFGLSAGGTTGQDGTRTDGESPPWDSALRRVMSCSPTLKATSSA
jgi:hypothetical protein